MLAFTNTIKTRDEAISEARAHQEADRFLKGTYWDNTLGRGCSVGCMTKSYRGKTGMDWHEAEEPLYGIPREVARLQDVIFEGLPIEKAKAWTVRFFEAIPQGADMTLVTAQFMHWLMTDPAGIRKNAEPDGLKAIDMVAALYARRISGEEPTEQEWKQAGSAAGSAAEAAGSAAEAAGSAAEAAHYEKMADKLIEILKASI